MKLEGTNRLHLALEVAFGQEDPYPTYAKDGRTLVSRGAWRCPVCDASKFAPHRLTVALDPDGDPPECHHGCSEGSIWRALGHQSMSTTKRTARASRKRTGDAANPQRDEVVSEGNISMGVISKDISKGVGREDEHREDRVGASGEASRNEARARALGISAQPGSEYPCVLPGHEHTARLTETRHGHWLYQCADGPPISLAELRAANQTGDVRRLSKIFSARWAERLDFEAGLLAPRPVSVRLPERCSEATRKVAKGMALFLGLRGERMAGKAFPFAREFIIAYCGVTNEEARWAMMVLKREGVIAHVGKNGPSNLWRLAEASS